MKSVAIILIGFWILILIQPNIIAYIVAIVFIFLGLNMLVVSGAFGAKNPDDPIRFAGYEIYRRKK